MSLIIDIMSLVFTQILIFIMNYIINRVEDERFNCEYEEIGEDCPVCTIDDMQWPIETGCGHRFCYDCLKNWLESRKKSGNAPTCPNCRAAVKTISSISWKSSVTWWKTIVKRCHVAVHKFYNPEPQVPDQSLTLKADIINNLSATLPKLVLISIFVVYIQCFLAVYDFINAQQADGNGEHSDQHREHLEKLVVMLLMYLMSATFLNYKYTSPSVVRFVNHNHN